MKPKLVIGIVMFFVLISSSYGYELYFYHNDHLGSPTAVTDSSGSVVWKTDYEPFGETINEEGANKLKYNAKEQDKTGLLYYGARYYNPQTARFITADTVKGKLIDTQSQNRYSYVKNNPMRYIDPTGNQETDPRLFANLLVEEITPIERTENILAGGFTGVIEPFIKPISKMPVVNKFLDEKGIKEGIERGIKEKIESSRKDIVSDLIPKKEMNKIVGFRDVSKSDTLLEFQKPGLKKGFGNLEFGLKASANVNIKELNKAKLNKIVGLATIHKAQFGLTYETSTDKFSATGVLNLDTTRLGMMVSEKEFSVQLSFDPSSWFNK